MQAHRLRREEMNSPHYSLITKYVIEMNQLGLLLILDYTFLSDQT